MAVVILRAEPSETANYLVYDVDHVEEHALFLSEEAAMAHAAVSALHNLGKRFGVYAFCAEVTAVETNTDAALAPRLDGVMP